MIFLLISPSFIASDYCYGIELKCALDRHHAGQARIIPIILRPVDWSGTTFAALQFFTYQWQSHHHLAESGSSMA